CLKAFCAWCMKRGYLDADPLKGLAPFDMTPKTRRRLLTRDEIGRLLDVAPEHRRLVYEVAVCTGLRANELRSLTVEHLDVRRSGLYLDAEWTKNRRGGFQPLPRALAARLKAFADSGEVERLYADAKGHGLKSKRPERPLLFVPLAMTEGMNADLKKAAIPKYAPDGKVDFHALRMVYINAVIEAGANVKEAQSLARHATADLTMNVYGRTRRDRLADLAEAVGGRFLGIGNTIGAQRKVVGAATPCDDRGYVATL
ncbi:unnamed protein product, partial [marine sediment metagenome]